MLWFHNGAVSTYLFYSFIACREGTYVEVELLSAGTLHVYTCRGWNLKSGVFHNYHLGFVFLFCFWKRSFIEPGAHRFSLADHQTPGEPPVFVPPGTYRHDWFLHKKIHTLGFVSQFPSSMLLGTEVLI